MKKTNLFIALLLATFSTVAFAGTLVKVEKIEKSTQFRVISKKNPAQFDLIYSSDSKSPVTVRIFDEAGRLIKVDKIKGKSSFIRTYNFKNLDAGKYTLQVETKDGKEEQIISYDPFRQNLVMEVISKENEKYNVLVSGFDKNLPVILRVYDDEGRLLNTEKIQVSGTFSFIYNLSKINSSSYTFIVRNGSESVTKFKDAR